MCFALERPVEGQCKDKLWKEKLQRSKAIYFEEDISLNVCAGTEKDRENLNQNRSYGRAW
jgi:hypothetical protein